MGNERELVRDSGELTSAERDDNVVGRTTSSQELEEDRRETPSQVESKTELEVLRRLRAAGKGGTPAAVAAIKKLLASGLTVAQIEARVSGLPERDEETTLRTLQRTSPAPCQARKPTVAAIKIAPTAIRAIPALLVIDVPVLRTRATPRSSARRTAPRSRS